MHIHKIPLLSAINDRLNETIALVDQEPEERSPADDIIIAKQDSIDERRALIASSIVVALVVGVFSYLLALGWHHLPERYAVGLTINAAVLGLLLCHGWNRSLNLMQQVRNMHRRASMERARFLEALSCLNEAFAWFDADERLIVCNSHYKRLKGDEDGEFIRPGRRLKDIVAFHTEKIYRDRPPTERRSKLFERLEMN